MRRSRSSAQSVAGRPRRRSVRHQHAPQLHRHGGGSEEPDQRRRDGRLLRVQRTGGPDGRGAHRAGAQGHRRDRHRLRARRSMGPHGRDGCRRHTGRGQRAGLGRDLPGERGLPRGRARGHELHHGAVGQRDRRHRRARGRPRLRPCAQHDPPARRGRVHPPSHAGGQRREPGAACRLPATLLGQRLLDSREQHRAVGADDAQLGPCEPELEPRAPVPADLPQHAALDADDLGLRGLAEPVDQPDGQLVRHAGLQGHDLQPLPDDVVNRAGLERRAIGPGAGWRRLPCGRHVLGRELQPAGPDHHHEQRAPRRGWRPSAAQAAPAGLRLRLHQPGRRDIRGGLHQLLRQPGRPPDEAPQRRHPAAPAGDVDQLDAAARADQGPVRRAVQRLAGRDQADAHQGPAPSQKAQEPGDRGREAARAPAHPGACGPGLRAGRRPQRPLGFSRVQRRLQRKPLPGDDGADDRRCRDAAREGMGPRAQAVRAEVVDQPHLLPVRWPADRPQQERRGRRDRDRASSRAGTPTATAFWTRRSARSRSRLRPSRGSRSRASGSCPWAPWAARPRTRSCAGTCTRPPAP